MLLGLGLVMPLGPQNAFIFQSAAVAERFRRILPILLISIICDATLVLCGVLGGELLAPIIRYKALLSLSGALFLFYLSVSMWKNARAAEWKETALSMSTGQQVAYTLSISLFNPHALLDTFVVIGSVSSQYQNLERQFFTLGCILADVFWFIGIALIGFTLKKMRNGEKVVRLTSQVSACIIFLIAIDLLIKTFS